MKLPINVDRCPNDDCGNGLAPVWHYCPWLWEGDAIRLVTRTVRPRARWIADLDSALRGLMTLEAVCDERKDGHLFDAARHALGNDD